MPRTNCACAFITAASDRGIKLMQEETGTPNKRKSGHFLMALSEDKQRRKRLLLIFGAIIIAVAVITVLALALALGLTFGLEDDSDSSTSASTDTYKTAAVATDAARCSEVGVEILRKGGNAVDAAIASLLCVGVINMHSTGIGGGGFLVYYNATSKTSTVIDHRETAPGRANYTGDVRGEQKFAVATQSEYCKMLPLRRLRLECAAARDSEIEVLIHFANGGVVDATN